MSDCHDNWENLEKAVNHANDENCDILLYAGDLITPSGLQILTKFKGKVHTIFGNNEGEKYGYTKLAEKDSSITLHGDVFEDTIDGIKIFMNHYPRLAELAAKSGEFDLCIHGHDHKYKEEKVNDTILLNPGEIQGYKFKDPCFVIFDTQKSLFRKISLL